MDHTLLYFSNPSEETQLRDDVSRGSVGDKIIGSNKTGHGSESREDRSMATPANPNVDLISHRHETTPNDVTLYGSKTDESGPSNRPVGGSEGVAERGTVTTTTSSTEFDTIAQEAALLLDKKLENNRAWVKKLVSEMTAYARTLSEVHSEYTRIQSLEHQESRRLDQVEPDVQGATSHLLDNPYIGGIENRMRREHDLPTAGSKRFSQ